MFMTHTALGTENPVSKTAQCSEGDFRIKTPCLWARPLYLLACNSKEQVMNSLHFHWFQNWETSIFHERWLGYKTRLYIITRHIDTRQILFLSLHFLESWVWGKDKEVSCHHPVLSFRGFLHTVVLGWLSRQQFSCLPKTSLFLQYEYPDVLGSHCPWQSLQLRLGVDLALYTQRWVHREAVDNQGHRAGPLCDEHGIQIRPIRANFTTSAGKKIYSAGVAQAGKHKPVTLWLWLPQHWGGFPEGLSFANAQESKEKTLWERERMISNIIWVWILQS